MDVAPVCSAAWVAGVQKTLAPNGQRAVARTGLDETLEALFCVFGTPNAENEWPMGPVTTWRLWPKA